MSAARPLNQGELFEAVRSSGVVIDGNDPVKNLGTALWKSGRFDNTGRIFWFKERQRPGRD